MTKMTYVSAIDYILNSAESTNGQDDATFVEACEKLEALKASLINRKSSSKKNPTKTQKENEGIKEKILSVLSEAEAPMTVSEFLTFSGLAGLSNQKVSALLRQLVEAGRVIKTMEKKKALFSLA